MRVRLPKTKLVSLVCFVLGFFFLPPCAAGRAMTVSGRVTRRLEDGGGCDGYTDSASVSTQADLQSAIDGSSSICIEITADMDLVGGYHSSTALGVDTGKDVRLWTSDGAVLNGQGMARLLIVENGAVVKLEGLTFYDGFMSGGGGSGGGAIYNNGGDVTITSCEFNNNSNGGGGGGSSGGGAIYNNGGDLTITSSAFNDNTTAGAGGGRCGGGAIYNNDGDLTITSCEFNSNTAASSRPGGDLPGGAIYNNDGDLAITSCEFNDNTASGEGDAILNEDGVLTIGAGCTVNGEEAVLYSGLGRDMHILGEATVAPTAEPTAGPTAEPTASPSTPEPTSEPTEPELVDSSFFLGLFTAAAALSICGCCLYGYRAISASYKAKALQKNEKMKTEIAEMVLFQQQQHPAAVAVQQSPAGFL